MCTSLLTVCMLLHSLTTLVFSILLQGYDLCEAAGTRLGSALFQCWHRWPNSPHAKYGPIGLVCLMGCFPNNLHCIEGACCPSFHNWLAVECCCDQSPHDLVILYHQSFSFTSSLPFFSKFLSALLSVFLILFSPLLSSANSSSWYSATINQPVSEQSPKLIRFCFVLKEGQTSSMAYATFFFADFEAPPHWAEFSCCLRGPFCWQSTH